MDKLLPILEEKVEWIALGLAGLWVLWIGWGYGISNPVAVEVNRQVLTPGQIDSVIAASPERQRLEAAMASADVPKMDVPDYVGEFVKAMTAQPTVAVASATVLSLPPNKPLDKPKGPEIPLVKKLPDVPGPTIQAARGGRSQVNLTEPPVPGAAPAPAAPTAAAVDKVWVSVFAQLDETAVDAEFKANGIPDYFNRKEFIQVELQRQEVTADGKPVGQPVLVQALSINRPPVDRKADASKFLDWALRPENQARILQAPFYPVVGGDKWEAFGAPKAAAEMVTEREPEAKAEFSLEAAVQHFRSLKTPQDQIAYRKTLTSKQNEQLGAAIKDAELKENLEKRQQQQQQQQNQKQKQPQTKQPKQPNTRDAQDPRVLREAFAQAALPAVPAASAAPAAPATAEGNAAAAAAPAGKLQIWAHDDSVEPGRSYKYQIRVILKNPMYKTNMVEKPELAQQLELVGAWSDWSNPVITDKAVEMQLTGVVFGKEQVKFNVWRWQNGKYNKASQGFSVSPGDTVGGIDRNSQINYATGWMLVDMRTVGNDLRVLLVNENGRTVSRSLKRDTSDPRFRELDAAATPPTAVTPAAPQ